MIFFKIQFNRTSEYICILMSLNIKTENIKFVLITTIFSLLTVQNWRCYWRWKWKFSMTIQHWKVWINRNDFPCSRGGCCAHRENVGEIIVYKCPFPINFSIFIIILVLMRNNNMRGLLWFFLYSWIFHIRFSLFFLLSFVLLSYFLFLFLCFLYPHFI